MDSSPQILFLPWCRNTELTLTLILASSYPSPYHTYVTRLQTSASGEEIIDGENAHKELGIISSEFIRAEMMTDSAMSP